MVNISADGGKGGDGHDGGIGGKGGQGGKVHVIANQITELTTLIDTIQNNPTIIIQKFDKIITEIENDDALNPEQKSNIKTILESIKTILISAEPYAKPFITKALEALATQT